MIIANTAGKLAPSTGNTTSQVGVKFLTYARDHGLANPLTGLDDPRLQNPEELLLDGWKRDSGSTHPFKVLAYGSSTLGDGIQGRLQEYVPAYGREGPALLTFFYREEPGYVPARTTFIEKIWRRSGGTVERRVSEFTHRYPNL